MMLMAKDSALPHDDLVPMSFPLGEAWFVAFVSLADMYWTKDRTGAEFFPVEKRIQEAGFETFVPRETRTILRGRRKVVRTAPLFGPYVFVRFDRERDRDRWGAIANIDGVHCILAHMQIPDRVPDLVIYHLKLAQDAGVFDYTRNSAFSEGQEVEIKHGPFAGLIARVRCASPRKKVKLLMDGLGTMEIDAAFLARV